MAISSLELPLAFTSISFRRLLPLSLIVLGVLVLGACSSSDEASTPTFVAQATPNSSGIADRYSALVAASEFVVGVNRFPFGLVDVNGEFLEGAAVTVRFFHIDDETATLKTEVPAHWRTIPDDFTHSHEDGSDHRHLEFRGIYVVDQVLLPETGIWIADFVALADGNLSPEIEEAGFRVLAEANAPVVGERVPATPNRTINEASFTELSTRQVESDELHNVSVADARDAGEPFVVVFASPQFCVSAMCGPVVEVMDDAREALGGAVEFIHIEPWDLVAARAEGQLIPSAENLEWHLPTEPWVFVVDREGQVYMRIEGLATEDEVVDSVRELL